jgi:hypothetical protein
MPQKVHPQEQSDNSHASNPFVEDVELLLLQIVLQEVRYRGETQNSRERTREIQMSPLP